MTGEPRYGGEKAANWLPAAWRPEIEGRSEEDMTAALTDARDALTAANSVQTIEQDRIDKAKDLLDSVIPGKEGELKTAKETADSITQQITDLSAKYSEHKVDYDALVIACNQAKAIIQDKAPLSCPGCGAGLIVKDNVLRGYASPEPEEIEKAKLQIETATPDITKLRAQCEEFINLSKSARVKQAEAQRTVHTIQGELNQLKVQARDAGLNAQQATPEAEIARLETAVQEARMNLDVFKQLADAKMHHDNVVEMDKICTLLGPNGARAKVMGEAMDKVRKILGLIQSITGWETIGVLSDYGITANGRPIKLTSDNEKLKAQWSMQIASAILTESQWVVLDKADTLRDESWFGLAKLLNRLADRYESLKIVVCGTSVGGLASDHWNVIEIGA